jgi:glucose/arabinose dehydrogenase
VGLATGAEPTPAAPPIGDGNGGVELRKIGDFSAPAYVAGAPGKRNRKLLFVVELGGVVRVVRDGKTLERPFLDISSSIGAGGEGGLLSIAFDPDYARNGRFYLYFTNTDQEIEIAQMRRSKKSKTRAAPRIRSVIEVPHPDHQNHYGATAAFGPDGKLWIGTGDGGGSCDPLNNSQNPESLLGKMLRISPTRKGGYRIPEGNPFVGSPGRDEIYATGLRNPFRFSFDRPTGTIAIADVGQDAVEEVDYESLDGLAGANFGWDAFEGDVRANGPDGSCSGGSAPTPPSHERPIHTYRHDGDGHTGCSITGGVVVRDRSLKTLYGRYIFADLCTGELRSLEPRVNGAVGESSVGLDIVGPTSFVAGPRKRVYATSLTGAVYRLAPSSSAPQRPAPAAARAPGDGRGGFSAEPVGDFDAPVYVTGPKGANGLVFVVEQEGTIRMIKDGKKVGGTFLDIRDKVRAGGEQGLLSVAFAPSYAKNRRFYVYFTDEQGDIKVQEYRRSKGNARDAKEGSARTVIDIRHRKHSNHNGGQLQFGPDRLLYIATGDGGSGGDPPENAQDKGSLLGKLLRIDPRRKGKRNYRIPKGNPFKGRPGADEVFSFGLRNPYRFSFDRGHRRIAIGDVGQDAREEIDYETIKGARGANFGWDAFEGFARFDSPDASPPPKNHTEPIFDYPHSGGVCAVTGGYVVRDTRIPSLFGRYIYGDFCVGEIRTLVPDTKRAKGDRSAGLANQTGLSSFGEDASGRIYFSNLITGKVFRIQPD